MTIFVVNPNSSDVVTAGIDRAMEPLRAVSPAPIAAIQLDEGPKGIETQAHVDGVVGPLLKRAAALENEASAFVVACFSDPGLAALREQSRRPVLGIAESAILTAMSVGQRFGVLSILQRSVPRHMRMFGAMGVMDRLAADLPLELGVADLADETRTFGRLQEVGRTLSDAHGADVLILGCAGMTRFRAALEDALERPVIEPCQAAAAMAIGRVALARAQQNQGDNR
ncbi:aspartate/glutamate racemase family protein [Aureimonas phyllosphaerae]|uniref:Asp/Glu/hydantoin racemase n=1 Tax=Aureimonas phyllosphaerae TaxID=1166078 RepID=A0A7W6BQM9_9HYPH|nr:aspartate/glutamate racemase family protein [Aureimonas phyllosphaerae]MBB3934239.1 Asp/Glu/hydantoin racemase [Aureimonas phyllosphaerae]MBB3958545.1 Asp/Glu/hydantoin racemase [Aureimonas phyllosphaerae]SFE98629.1 Asp/Glu/hydantoin racemase [Aureimonas phyllosphaerae]